MMPKILIADDEQCILEVLTKFLTLNLFKVKSVKNGDDVLRAFSGNTDFGLLILDLHMPGKSSYDLLKELKQNKTHIPVIILSGLAQADDESLKEIKKLKYPGLVFLHKPMELEDLLKAVKQKLAAI